MANFAVIKRGVVVNIVVAGAPLADDWVQSDTAAIGDLYENGEFIRPPTPPAPVPEVITPRQAKIALLQAGLLDDVEAAIAAIPDETTRRIAQVDWADAQEVRRDWPLLVQMAGQMGLTDTQVDELFRAGASV